MERPVPKIQTREIYVERINVQQDICQTKVQWDMCQTEVETKVNLNNVQREQGAKKIHSEEHCPEILKDISGYVNDHYY